MPSPVDIPPIKGVLENEEQDIRNPDDKEPFSALVFKIATDPFVGTLSFIEVYSGTLKAGVLVISPISASKVRVGRLFKCI